MNKMQAIGAPFLVEHSSCSDLKPKNFEWTTEDCPIKVFIDGAIAKGVEYIKKEGETKIAWVCESRTIFHSMHMERGTWENTLEKICDYYDVVFTSEKSMMSVHPKVQFAFAGSNLPWIKTNLEEIEKTKMCSMIASKKNFAYGHKLRHAIAENFGKYIDLFGGIQESPRISGVDSWDKSQGLVDYMFSFVVENDRYETYYTEKLTDCFKTGTIPIYWGAPDIGNYFDVEGIIELTPDFNLTSLSKELYESKIEAAIRNYQKVIELEMADDYLFNEIKKYAN